LNLVWVEFSLRWDQQIIYSRLIANSRQSARHKQKIRSFLRLVQNLIKMKFLINHTRHVLSTWLQNLFHNLAILKIHMFS